MLAGVTSQLLFLSNRSFCHSPSYHLGVSAQPVPTFKTDMPTSLQSTETISCSLRGSSYCRTCEILSALYAATARYGQLHQSIQSLMTSLTQTYRDPYVSITHVHTGQHRMPATFGVQATT